MRADSREFDVLDDHRAARLAVEMGLVVRDEGTYELRLVDHSPRRLSGVAARSRIKVDRPAVARNEAPAWYW